MTSTRSTGEKSALAPSRLTAEQRRSWRDDGYLVLDGFVDGAACDALRARAAELVADFDPTAHRSIFTTDEQARKTDDHFLDSGDDVRFFFEEGAFDAAGNLTRPKELAINKIAHALHDLDPLFDRFSRTAALRALVSDLGIAEPLLMQSMYIFKQPHIGGEVRCHQDSTFLHTAPESLVGLWFALEDATTVNGCLWALPGAHRAGLKQRFIRNADRTTRFDTYDASPWNEATRVPLEVKKGAVIALHGLLPHMSETNRSPRSRHAYTLHAVDAKGAYPETNWLRRRASMPARGF